MKKVALVTGSAKGIGAAIIEELALRGYNVVINYNNSEKDAYALEKSIKKYNVDCLVIKCDISNENQVKEMFEKITNKFNYNEFNKEIDNRLLSLFELMGVCDKEE